ncbi:DUF1566 domain-containing protein [Emticicia agri]|uniref:DUF1566 domain-containing protein n=1 Tax=Emticicia agri TaxID=2492393 RepID=A0A4Q5LW92_9BACT|nr:DUF1566 domain-containing protein [Emticicia agri]RYU93829.1 DUF1566 domain-containing protein [Emticicia agri]
MRQISLLLVAVFLFTYQLSAQSVTITPSGTSALIDTKSTTGGVAIPSMSMTQRAALTPKAGLQVFCNNCSPVGAYMYDGTQWKAMFNITNGNTTIYSVGQQAQGGTVIWVDDSGQHGIVAAPADVPMTAPFPYGNIGVKWGDMVNDEFGFPMYVMAMGTGVFDGEKNTEILVHKFGWTLTGAFLCRQMNFNRYGGWYLPSIAELTIMYENRQFLTGFSNTVKLDSYYWSSSEATPTEGTMLNFFDGEISNYTKNKHNHEPGAYPFYAHRARAVRRF